MNGFVYPGAAFLIHGFAPPPDDMKNRMGGMGIGIDLDAVYARKLLNTPMSDKTLAMLHRISSERLKAFFPGMASSPGWEPHYGYKMEPVPGTVSASWLIRGLDVPGNCACLFASDGISDLERATTDMMVREHEIDPEHGYKDAIRFVPHNIDTLSQASAMLSLWLRWYNAATATVKP